MLGNLGRRSFLVGAGAAALAARSFSVARAADLKNGGTLTVTYMNEMASLDPAIGYEPASWNLIRALFDGLMGFETGTTKVVPFLAESFAVSPDGLTYTFTLRADAKFHNGRAIKADDVVYSLDRVVDPATKSPGQQFFASILGFKDRAGGTSKQLDGVRATGERTIEIKLSHPDASFLEIMAINFSYPVPRENVEKGNFGKNPVGSGAFKLQEWVPGQQVTLVRNPDYYQKGLPHLDKLVVRVGIDPVTALLQFQHGDVDLLGNGVPASMFNQVVNDPKYKDDILQAERLITRYITMKTTIKPFDDKRVRQAVNHAINKQRLVQLTNNRAHVTNQVLPPGMGGYDKDYKGYDFNPGTAKAMLAAAGLANGFSTQLYATNIDPDPRIAQSIQQDLANVGITADLRVLAEAQVIDAGGDPNEAPMVWSGATGWGADYPDPSDFWFPLLASDAATKGGWNWCYYRRPDLDEKAKQANSIADPAKDAERFAQWAALYREVMDDAPWVPVYNDVRFMLKQPRIMASPEVLSAPTFPLMDFVRVYATNA
ncbi:MAG TPA: ABC transporter substrate-binding protein [Stellaceae bacterium]|jgi:ABC-type transport system substrate-binding protein|nr:ABC transporter substrate-binding protein [Stellaceae bacterium]